MGRELFFSIEMDGSHGRMRKAETDAAGIAMNVRFI